MKYTATVIWAREKGESFTDNKYSRAHQWIFDGGISVPASASPQIVPLPFSQEKAVDPEESFIAAVSSCHMLFFLSFAAKRKYVIDKYEDHATGVMGKNEAGKMTMLDIYLQPKLVFLGTKIPTEEQVQKLHNLAHKQCFIANSITSTVHINLSE